MSGSESSLRDGPVGDEADAQPALDQILLSGARCPFGPPFFLTQLAAFIRERCPDPAEHLPQLDLWVDGERVAVCHVVAIAPDWIAVAARDEEEAARMRTEIVPYASIRRVTIGGAPAGVRTVGFEMERPPRVLDASS